jgi:PAS domain S-box-containing protein
MSEKAAHILDTNTGFKILFDFATIGIIVVGKRGIIKLANPFAEKLFGYNEGELKGQMLDVLIPNDLRKVHLDHHAGYFTAPKERSMGKGIDLFAKRKDGAVFPVEISLGHYEIEGETFAVTYITDITVRKKGEEELKQSEKKFRFLFDNSNDVRAFYKVVFDDKGNVADLIIEEANPSYKKVMQESGHSGDFVGRSIVGLTQEYIQHFKECEVAMRTFKSRTYQRFNPVTRLYLLTTIIPIDKDHCFAYGIDITTQKRIENELSELNEELEHRVEERTEALAKAINDLAASKDEVVQALEKEKELNELKSRFITTASHEFRTPLATILSSVTLIEKYSEKEEQAKRKKHIDRIQSSITNLTEILNDFLSLNKLEEGVVANKPESIKLDEFVNKVFEENKSILKAGQKVNYLHSNGNVNAEVDSQIFKNVILNLFSNAVKYSDEGKSIDVATKEENGIIELKIKDYGIGIPEKDQKFLFTRFFRAKNAINIEGTGLGLNIVKKYVDLLNGNISFTSKLGEGSEFVVKIPAKQ